MSENPQITRRHLPHGTSRGASYFITFCTNAQNLSIEEQQLVLEHLRLSDGRFYAMCAAVVMPDHVHLIISSYDQTGLSRIMKGIKGGSARKINLLRNARGKIWQDESYDHILRNQSDLDEKIKYMLENPVKKGLTSDPMNYHGWFYNPDPQFLNPLNSKDRDS